MYRSFQVNDGDVLSLLLLLYAVAYLHPYKTFDYNYVCALQNVGFIGLGNMGSRMATNLLKSGFRVSVHDM